MNTSHGSQDGRKGPHNKHSHISIRINVFFFATFILFTVLILRLAYLQFVRGPELAAEQNKTAKQDVMISPIRGNIYDRHGAPIASTVSVQTAFFQITPDQTVDGQIAVARKLEEIFNQYGSKDTQLTAKEIMTTMDVGYDIDNHEIKQIGYMYWPRRIKSNLTKEEIAVIAEHRDELPGIEVSEESSRVYVDPVAVQLVGYMRPFKTLNNTKVSYLNTFYKDKNLLDQNTYSNDEYIGFDGLEFMYQDELRGSNGSKRYEVNSLNQVLSKAVLTPPEKGHNLILAMDKNVQRAAEQGIKDNLTNLQTSHDPYVSAGNQALAGYAVAMEVDTGKVMAMASIPDYNPNEWIGGFDPSRYEQFQNAVPNGTIRDRQPIVAKDQANKHPSSLVPLGSTQKPLTILLGLNEGLITPYTTYNDTGVFQFGKDVNGKPITNSDREANGPINPVQALIHSSNTFMSSQVGLPLYNKYGGKSLPVWDRYMKQFGLGILTGSGLPGESPGLADYTVIDKNTTAQANQVLASFGQKGKYTTLQLAQYAVMLANHGKRVQPQFLDRITTYDGKILNQFNQANILNTVNYPDSFWNLLRDGMKSPVDGFDGFNYNVARKTGTSEQLVGGKTIDNAVFIAYAPLEKPKLAIAVVVPEGGFGRYGAAPIARKIFDAYDQYFGLDGTPKGMTQVTTQIVGQ